MSEMETHRSDSDEPGTELPGEDRTNGNGRGGTARDMLAQLQSIIDNLATQAAPVVREVGAKAAELAAVAAEKAGPIAQKTADVTQEAGVRLAERAREVAADLRRAADESDTATAEAGTMPQPGTTTDEEAGSPSA